MLPVFFGRFFWRLSPSFCGFFRVRSVLGFFLEDFLLRTLEWEFGVFLGMIFGSKNARFSSQKRRKKVLPFLGLFFRSSIFVTAGFLRRVLGIELRFLSWMCF